MNDIEILEDFIEGKIEPDKLENEKEALHKLIDEEM